MAPFFSFLSFDLGRILAGMAFAALLPAALAVQALAADVTIQVKDSNGNNLPSVDVFAVEFTTNGIGPNTTVMLTQSNGATTFFLNDNVDYFIGASTQAYFPTLKEQMHGQTANDLPNRFSYRAVSGDNATINVTLNPDATREVGFFKITLTNAVALGCFGFRREGSEEDIGLTIAKVDGAGNGAANFHNIPTDTSVATYTASGFSNDLSCSSSTVTTVVNTQQYDLELDFDPTICLPPNRQTTQANVGGGSGGGSGGQTPTDVSVEGVVQSTFTNPLTNQPIYVPWSGIDLRVKSIDLNSGTTNFWGQGWTNTDENGRFRMYGLTPGNTYYLTVHPNCDWRTNTCFEGFTNPALKPNTTTYDPTPGFDFYYNPDNPTPGQTYNGSTLQHRIKIPKASGGAGQLRVAVKDTKGRAIPNAQINIWHDWTNWHSSTATSSSPDFVPYLVDTDFNGIRETTRTALCEQGAPGQSWHFDVDLSSPGLGQFNIQATTGYTVIPNMRPGNYQVQVWTDFTNEGMMYNAGADGKWSWDEWNSHKGCTQTSMDDVRVQINDPNVFTNGLGDSLKVYDASGTYLSAITSITIIVNAQANTGAVMRGKLKFPTAVNIANEPITMTLRKNCEEQTQDCWKGGGYDVVPHDDQAGQTLSEYDYEINVTTGRFWMEIRTDYWGIVREGGGGSDQVELKTTTTVVKNMSFARAGRIRGNLLKPDGSRFIPGNTENGYVSGNINANGEGNGWGYTQVSNDGSFVIGGLLPGKYTMRANTWGGNANYAMPDQTPKVTVTAQNDSYQDVQFLDAEMVKFDADTSLLPVLISTPSEWGDLEGEHYRGLRLPAGTPMNAERAQLILADEGDWDTRIVQRSTTPQNQYPCNSSFNPTPNKWCPLTMGTGFSHDFYLVRWGDAYGWCDDHCDPQTFNPNDTGGTQFYFTIVNSTKNIAVTKDAPHDAEIHRKDWQSVSTFSAVDVNLSPAATVSEGAVLTGTVTAVNIIREQDFRALAGDWEKFMNYLPVVVVYDENKNLLGAGMVTPTVKQLAPVGHEFDAIVSSGDWVKFSNLLGTFTEGWQYMIRGLPAGKKVFASLTTPNYPPVIFDLTMGVVGSTTNRNFNLDTLGAGASISGVVTPTTSTAVVYLDKSGLATRKVSISTTTGGYGFNGLGAGVYKLKVEAGGYSTARDEVEVTEAAAKAASTFTKNFTLSTLPPGSVEGRIFASRLPFSVLMQGAKVCAINETFNIANPTKLLIPLAVKTSSITDPSQSNYRIEGLNPGDTYKIFAVGGGYRKAVAKSTVAINGAITRFDFDLELKPEIDVSVKKEGGYFNFIVTVPDKFFKITATFDTAPYDGVGITTITFPQVSGTDTKYTQSMSENLFAGSPTWVLRVVAKTLEGRVLIKNLTFGPAVPSIAQAPLDNILAGCEEEKNSKGVSSNELVLDNGETRTDYTGISFPLGSAIDVSSGGVPTAAITAKSTDTLTGGQACTNCNGNAYQIDVSSIQFTGKPIEVTIQYDKTSAGANSSDLCVLFFDTQSNKWTCDSTLTVTNKNEDTGNITVKVNPNSSRAFGFGTNGTYGTLGLPRYGSMSAKVVNGQFSYNPLNHGAGSGLFAVGVAAAGGVATDGKFHAYNYPNPFDLKSKTVSFRTGTGGVNATITGTYIVVAPTGSGTVNTTVRIYNVAGDLVRELVDTATAGQYNYFHWDGKNKSGSEVASGVYFATIDAPGAPKKEPIKLVVVK